MKIAIQDPPKMPDSLEEQINLQTNGKRKSDFFPTWKNFSAVLFPRLCGLLNDFSSAVCGWSSTTVVAPLERLVELSSRSVTSKSDTFSLNSASSLSSSTLYDDENERSPMESKRYARFALGKLFDPFFNIGLRRGVGSDCETCTLNSGWISTFEVENPMLGEDDLLECFISMLWLPFLKTLSWHGRKRFGESKFTEIGYRFSSVNITGVSGWENDWFFLLWRSSFGRSLSQSVSVIKGIIVCEWWWWLQLHLA